MYSLYYAPGAASLVVHWLLIESGVPHELRLVDTQAKQQKSAEYLALNPNGVVPTLIDADGKPLYEAAALVLLLADRHAEQEDAGKQTDQPFSCAALNVPHAGREFFEQAIPFGPLEPYVAAPVGQSIDDPAVGLRRRPMLEAGRRQPPREGKVEHRAPPAP